MNLTGRTAVLALAAALIFGAGVLTGWKLYAPKAAPPSTNARAVEQRDGSLILERRPLADAKPAHEIPKGAKVERVVQVQVRPRAVQPPHPGPADVAPRETWPSGPVVLAAPAAATPPPFRVDLSLIRLPDQSRRVVASSPDGEVVGGLDVPAEEPKAAKPYRWATGAVYGTTAWGDTALGVFIDRDLGPFRTGGELTRNTASDGRRAWEIRGKIGLRF